MTTRAMFMDPMMELARFQREVNRLLDGYCQPSDVFPRLNAWADNERAVVRAEVPGVAPEAVRLTVTGDLLALEGERDTSPTEMKGSMETHRQERMNGAFRRVLRLPWDIEASAVSARQKNGVLTVTLPRRESTKPRTISVAAD